MKKLSPLMVVHFILMLVLLLLSVASAVMLIAGVGFDFGALKTDSHVSVTLFGVFNLVNALALCFGIVYLLKGYTKKAAPLYKASLLTRVAATVICIVMMTFNFSAQGAAQALVIAIIVLLAGKGAVMAYMTFKKHMDTLPRSRDFRRRARRSVPLQPKRAAGPHDSQYLRASRA